MTRNTFASLPNMGFAAQGADAATTEGAPKDWVRLFPMGVVQGRDGRGPYRLDDLAHAQRVVAASLRTAGGTDIPVDYDHQIPFSVRDGIGGNAPAAGWIKGLEARGDGIWAKIEWTAAATAKIKAREYRYISPFFSFDTTSGALTRIWNAGLLNLSNFTELAAVAAAAPAEPDDGFDELAKKLGLSPEAVTRARALLKAWNEKDAHERARIGTIYSDPEALLRDATAAAMVNPDAPLTSDEKAMAARFGISETAFRDSKKQILQRRI